jgi:CBS domain-containing protein
MALFDRDQRHRRHDRRMIRQNQENPAMSITAADIMTSQVTAVTRHTNMAEIASLLASKHLSAVPVCDPDNKIVGIVSESDILKPFRESVRTRRDWWLGVMAEGEELPQDFLDYIGQDKRTAADVMTSNVLTIEEDSTLPQIAELMIKHAIKRLPVVRDGKLVGIVSRADLVAAIARTPGMRL